MSRQWFSLRMTHAAGCVASISGLGAPVAGCWSSNPCDPGQILRSDSCLPAPATPGDASSDGGSDSGGSIDAGGIADGRAAPSTFGMTCAVQADCAGGDAPICGAPQLPYCTQINCQAGEANAGACPSGWQCIMVAPNPSVCLH
jgi:hypothetical protein